MVYSVGAGGQDAGTGLSEFFRQGGGIVPDAPTDEEILALADSTFQFLNRTIQGEYNGSIVQIAMVEFTDQSVPDVGWKTIRVEADALRPVDFSGSRPSPLNSAALGVRPAPPSPRAIASMGRDRNRPFTKARDQCAVCVYA